ncbi:hypothetical protein QR685DRAFT_575650 [Neurospora intermedia]|uniref:Uncharacterized protein n=1 Tax=Neurospora intermedia TaxID=5142 RepID=A0ABR3D033_NEUIN
MWEVGGKRSIPMRWSRKKKKGFITDGRRDQERTSLEGVVLEDNTENCCLSLGDCLYHYRAVFGEVIKLGELPCLARAMIGWVLRGKALP